MGNVQSVMSNKRWLFCFMAAFPLCTAVNAQQATTAVPRLVNFAGRVTEGIPHGGPAAVGLDGAFDLIGRGGGAPEESLWK